jgi:hypothetical protein
MSQENGADMGFLVRSLGCLFVLVLFPLAIPILLFYASFKLLAFALRDAQTTKPDRRRTRYSRDLRSGGLRARSDERPAGRFDGLFRRDEPTERIMKRHAQQLAAEICEALDYNQRIPTEKKSYLKEQTRQLADHALASLEKVTRIQRRKTIVNVVRREELEQLERRLLAEIKRSLEILEDALVSIITVDVVGGNSRIDRLVGDLYESNARLRDIAEAHQEIRAVRGVWVGELD